MSRVFLAAALVLASASPALADGAYAGLGFGGGAEIGGQLAERYDASGQVGGRLMAGWRTDEWALEGVLFGTDVTDLGARLGTESSSTLSLGVDLKYFLSLTNRLELYGRLGLNQTWIVADPSQGLPEGQEPAGRGWIYGAGAQYQLIRLGTPGLNLAMSVWGDWSRQTTSLGEDLSGHITFKQLGLAFGGNF
jgi:hypothetical protein